MIAAFVYVCAAALAAPSGEIAFIGTSQSGPARIHILSIGTNNVRTVGPDNALGPPAWSPDGLQLAFAVQTPSGAQIYVADADGASGRFLNHAQSGNTGPVWSPDGTQIAYTASAGLDAQVMVATLATGDERPWGGGRTSLMMPAWTTQRVIDRLFERLSEDARPSFLPVLPSGAPSPPVLVAIGFVGGATRTTDLFLLSEDEAAPLDERLLLAPGAYEESAPSVSKEGIAFDSNDGGDREIFVIGRRKSWDASNNAAADWRPVWSPDAHWIAFESFRSGTRGIYRCHKQSSRISRIVASPASDCWGAAWSPDSAWIAFTSDANGGSSVWVVRADGEDLARVSPEGMSAGHAAWRPAQ